MDYTQIIEDFKNTQEFKDFLKLVNGNVISTKRQEAGGTIFIGSIEMNMAWGFFANGYVRDGYYGLPKYGQQNNTTYITDTQNLLRRPPKDGVKNVDLSLYLTGLDVVIERIEKRNDSLNKKFEKLNSNSKHQKLLLYFIFDTEKLEQKNYEGNWVKISNWYLDAAKHLDFDEFVKKYGIGSFTKEFRLKK